MRRMIEYAAVPREKRNAADERLAKPHYRSPHFSLVLNTSK
jgi:hypothetical protein